MGSNGGPGWEGRRRTNGLGVSRGRGWCNCVDRTYKTAGQAGHNPQLVPLDPMKIKLSLCLEGKFRWRLEPTDRALQRRSAPVRHSDTIKEALARAAEPTGLG